MSRCSKTTTARPGSGKLSRAKHVVGQRLQPTVSPHLSSLWDCDSSLLAAPKSAIPRSASRAHLVGLHLPSWPRAGRLQWPPHPPPPRAAPGGPLGRGLQARQTTLCLMFPGHGVITTWWADGFQTWFSFYFFWINKLHKVHKTLRRWIHFYICIHLCSHHSEDTKISSTSGCSPAPCQSTLLTATRATTILFSF